jgi:tripartite motif-containing protein 71
MLLSFDRVFALAALGAAAVALIAAGPASAAYVQQKAWGARGGAGGQFQSPQGVATLPGEVFVADAYNSRIQRFDPQGNFRLTWGWGVADGKAVRQWCTGGCRPGIRGRGYGQLITPTDVSAVNGYVFVADFQGSRIQRFNSDGRGAVATWGGYGVGNTQFKNPASVAADFAGNVYVADTGNNRIKKFSSTGAFLAKWGTEGAGNAQFQYPWGIATDREGNVYVADTYNHRIQKFSSEGRFLAKWGRRGTGKGQFVQPFGVATDLAGNVYVADTFNNRIEKFSPKGVFLGQWGKPGSGKGQLRSPQDVATDRKGAVYVADTGNHRIVKYANVSR